MTAASMRCWWRRGGCRGICPARLKRMHGAACENPLASSVQIEQIAAPQTFRNGSSMPLKVAVQMDPIATINIRGDSTFALLLEAKKRGHSLSYYTPERLSLNGRDVIAA